MDGLRSPAPGPLSSLRVSNEPLASLVELNAAGRRVAVCSSSVSAAVVDHPGRWSAQMEKERAPYANRGVDERRRHWCHRWRS